MKMIAYMTNKSNAILQFINDAQEDSDHEFHVDECLNSASKRPLHLVTDLHSNLLPTFSD